MRKSFSFSNKKCVATVALNGMNITDIIKTNKDSIDFG